MSDKPDEIDAYCARIGYSGPREPTLAALRALVLAHTTAIPFENIDVLLKRPIRLDLPSIYAKLVHGRRGGYCFEQNLLFLDVLNAFGFRGSGLAARVMWGRPPGSVAPRTHMLLRVEIAGESYLADVGFGGITPTAPLALTPGLEQPTPHGTFRLIANTGEFDLEAIAGERWVGVYRFSLQEQLRVGYELANWFTSTHPNSLFVNHLIAGRADHAHRYAVFNNRFTIRNAEGGSESRRVLRSVAEFDEILGNPLGIGFLAATDLAAIAAIAEAQAEHPSPFEA